MFGAALFLAFSFCFCFIPLLVLMGALLSAVGSEYNGPWVMLPPFLGWLFFILKVCQWAQNEESK